jgi:hypothetical protein
VNRVAALTLFRASRDWRPYFIAVAVAAVAGVLLGRNNIEFSSFVGYYGPVALAIAIIGGVFEYSQRGSVWLMLAQRPGGEQRRLWTILGFAAAAYLAANAVMLSGVVAGIAINPDESASRARGALLVLPLWAVMIAFATAAASTITRGRSAAISILWILSPFIIGMVQTSLGFSDSIRRALEFLLPPFEAVFQLPAVLRGDRPDQAVLFSAQLVSFPILCLLILRWRIAILAKPDRIRSE